MKQGCLPSGVDVGLREEVIPDEHVEYQFDSTAAHEVKLELDSLLIQGITRGHQHRVHHLHIAIVTSNTVVHLQELFIYIMPFLVLFKSMKCTKLKLLCASCRYPTTARTLLFQYIDDNCTGEHMATQTCVPAHYYCNISTIIVLASIWQHRPVSCRAQLKGRKRKICPPV